MTTPWELIITGSETIRCLYGEAIDLHAFGTPSITRGSHVEPTADGRWTADMHPVGGPRLGPCTTRSAALEAEQDWLQKHWLPSG